jgi:ParB family chromosome partitioning protein
MTRRSTAHVTVGAILSVDPLKCRVWSLHDRLAGLDERACSAEIDSFRARGQLVPALGRRVTDDPDCEYELICGARRLFAARHLKMPLLLELRELGDREALAAMDAENRQRQDISPYERGVGYRSWLQKGVFGSQEELARALHLSTSQVSRSLRMARLPAVVVDAFRDPGQIRECWGLAILDALDDPGRRPATLRAARTLASLSPRLPAGEVVRRLLCCLALGRKSSAGRRDRVVPGHDGSPLFRVRHQSQAVALVFSAAKLSRYHLERIESRLTTILLAAEGSPQRPATQHPGKPAVAPGFHATQSGSNTSRARWQGASARATSG